MGEGLGGVASDLLQVDRHQLALIDEPGAFFHFDLAVQLAVDDGRAALQTHSEPAPLDVHHHVPALDAEADVERHNQLQRAGQRSDKNSVRVSITLR